VLARPRLPAQISPDLARSTSVVQQAKTIAQANVLAGLEPRQLADGTQKWILCAGLRNFREPWARDTGFATFGLLEFADPEIIRDTLEVFLLTQAEDGQFPVKIHSTHMLDRYFHSLFGRQQPVHKPIQPKFLSAHKTVSLDGTALIIIAILAYVERTGDLDFARQHWSALRRAARWLESHADPEDGLVVQGPYGDWADSIARGGKVHYTNVLYWRSLDRLKETARVLARRTDQQHFAQACRQAASAIQEHFWQPDLGYFVTSSEFANLSSCGNLLAVAWELAGPEQADQVLDRIQAFGMADPVPTQPAYPHYPREKVAFENRLGGVAGYHMDHAWLWLGAWHVIALKRRQRLAEAEHLLHKMARTIVRDGEVHEVYTPEGSFASTFWYTSEAPLTWSAAMFIHAAEALA
jgi:glycogen debranching enzyme